MIPRVRGVLLLAVTLALGGCSAGPASVQSEAAVDAGVVRLEFSTEGKNSFTALGSVSCDAEKEGTCQVEIPVADLQPGWNEIEIDTRRRTGGDGPLVARFYVGDEAFARRCDVERLGGPDVDSLSYELTCSFPDGFAGRLFDRELTDGKVTVPALDVPLKGLPEDAGVTRPLVVADIPLEVVNRAGGVVARPVRVVLPLPLVQLSVEGWQDPWYEPSLPLRIRAEAGSEILVDGEAVRPTRDGGSFVHTVRADPGPNKVVVEARRAGRHPARVELQFTSKAPDTPLYIDEPGGSEIVTTSSNLTIRGSTLPEAKLYLGGRPVDLGRGGTFEVVVSLNEGDNDVDLLAVVDPGLGVRQRPATRRSFKVHVTPDPEGREQAEQETFDPTGMSKVLGELRTDPWRHLDALVQFAFRVESASTSLAGGSCSAKLEGLACTHSVEQELRVGFDMRLARACDGEELPAVIELDACPDVEVGQRLDVIGRVKGGLGGRVGEWTVERPRIQGLSLSPSPFLEPKPGAP